MTHEARIKDPAASVDKALRDRAGKVVLTLRSVATGARLTYAASPVADNDRRWFLGLLTGPDNDADYSYIGLVEEDRDGRLSVRATRKGRPDDDPAMRAFALLLRGVQAGAVHPGLEVWHSGRCLRCARTLTVPESIETGLGPVCARRS